MRKRKDRASAIRQSDGMETRIHSCDFVPEETVAELMTRAPASIRVFLDWKMGCVGCPISPFHTLRIACEEHGLDLEAFLAALRSAALEA